MAKICFALRCALLLFGVTLGTADASRAGDERTIVDAIRVSRLANNRAIAAHDLKAFAPMFADDAVFVWSNGSSAVGKADLEKKFAQDFADPAFITYIRTPNRISVSDTGLRAVEHGTWTALKHNAQGETRYGGDYAAHWAKDDKGWHVRGELYVKLHCTGSLCTP